MSKLSTRQLHVLRQMRTKVLRVHLWNEEEIPPYCVLLDSQIGYVEYTGEHVFTRTWRSLEERGLIQQDGPSHLDGMLLYFVLTDKGKAVADE